MLQGGGGLEGSRILKSEIDIIIIFLVSLRQVLTVTFEILIHEAV